jgi:hypothetical protein
MKMDAHQKNPFTDITLVVFLLLLSISNVRAIGKEPAEISEGGKLSEKSDVKLTNSYSPVLLENSTNPPENDLYTSATEVQAGIPYHGSSEGATGDYFSGCGGNTDDLDVWHVFTPKQSGLVIVSLLGSDFDTTLAVYDQSGVTELACNDDAAGMVQSQITIEVDTGTSYLIRIAGYNHRTGDYILTIDFVLPPENDDCENAIEVMVGFPYLGSTIGASGNNTSGCRDTDNLDVWHIFTPNQSGTTTISLIGSSFDTTLAIYDKCSGTELTCNDDAWEAQSVITMQVVAGNSYLLRIAGYNHQTGDYILNIYFPPVNDDCTDAIEVYTGIPYYGSTNGATGETTSSCYDTDTRDVWHVFTPTQSGLVSFSLLDSCFNTTLAIYDGCNGTELACSDNANNSPQSEITMPVQAGITYYIRVAGIQHMTGDYVLTIAPPIVPENDECINAIEIQKGLYKGSSHHSTGTIKSSCGLSDDRDVWYVFTPTQSELVLISLWGSSFDTTLSVYDKCDGTELACSHDANDIFYSLLTMPVEAGKSYLIRIAGYNHRTGDYVLTISSAVKADECTDAIEIEAGIPYYGNTFYATGDSTTNCGNFDVVDVWHIYTPTQSGNTTFSLLGSDFDTTLAIYDQCGGTELACNDDFNGTKQSQVVMYVDANTPYLIRVAGFNHQQGFYVLKVDPNSVPANDDCNNAAAITEGVPWYGNTQGATGDNTSACSGSDMLDVWHIYTPAKSGNATFSLAGSSFDTTLAVYDQCGGTELICNDDAAGTRQSEVTMPVNGGTSYLIRVAGYDNQTGLYVLTITQNEPPQNDECSNAVMITEGIPFYGSIESASNDGNSSCGGSNERDVWHIFTPTRTGLFIFRLYAAFESSLAVFDQCQGTELACNDNTCNNAGSEVVMHMIKNTSYLIRVAGTNPLAGEYVIEAAMNPLLVTDVPNTPFPVDKALNVPVETVLSWKNATTSSYPVQNTSPVTLEAVFGNDDRRDEYQVNDPALLAAGDATVVIVPLSKLISNSDDSYTLSNQTFTDKYFNDTERVLCPDELYRDQPAPGLFSGFLVAPDIIATTGSCVECTCELRDIAVVFGFVMQDVNIPKRIIPAQDVYFARDIIALQTGYPDWALVRLDRPVIGHSPLPLRQAGKINDNQSLAVIGYPMGVPRKYDLGGVVKDNSTFTYFQSNLDTYAGSSGSVVLNLNTMTVEGFVARSLSDFIRDQNGGCDRSNVLSNDNWDWVDVTRITALSPLIYSYDVYLGTTATNLELIQSASAVTMFEPEILQPMTKYYWQIIAHGPSGEKPGPIWEFTTDK